MVVDALEAGGIGVEVCWHFVQCVELGVGCQHQDVELDASLDVAKVVDSCGQAFVVVDVDPDLVAGRTSGRRVRKLGASPRVAFVTRDVLFKDVEAETRMCVFEELGKVVVGGPRIALVFRVGPVKVQDVVCFVSQVRRFLVDLHGVDHRDDAGVVIRVGAVAQVHQHAVF